MKSDPDSAPASYSPRFAAALALAIGIAVSVSLSVWLRTLDKERDAEFFRHEALEQIDAFGNRLEHAVDALTLLNQLFVAVGPISAENFHAIAQPVLKHHPSIHAFAYRPAASVNEPQSAARDFVEPGRRRAFLHRLDSEAAGYHDEAMREIARTGLPAATRIFTMDREDGSGSERAFCLIMPVLRHESKAGAKAADAPDIAGYTLALFRLDDLTSDVHSANATHERAPIQVAVSEGRPSGDAGSARRNIAGGLPVAFAAEKSGLPAGARRSASSTFDIVGKELTVTVSGRDQSETEHAGAWLVLIVGIVASMLLAAYLLSSAAYASALRRMNRSLVADINARERLVSELRASHAELRALTSHQHLVREDERKRIAREIHDDLGQNLLVLRIDLTLLDSRTAVAHPDINQTVLALLKQVDVAMKSVRAIISDLRPGALDVGLCAAIEWQVRQLNKRTTIVFDLVIDNEDFGSALDDECATSIFRVVQEALTNVVRHANARRVEVRLSEHADRLRIVIADDGVGTFPKDQRKPRSFGLIGIKERIRAMGAELTVESIPSRGTTLSLSIATGNVEATMV